MVSTVNRLLAGIFNQPVTVQFIVRERPSAVEDQEDDGLSLVEIPEPEDHPKVLTLQAEYKSAYDEIVQPDHVIVFPGYFLRYIPVLGPELAWLYIGFRQAAYEAGATLKPGKKFGAPAKKIARFSGMSPRTFWRWAARPDTWKLLSWLVKPVEEQPRWTSGSDGHPHRATHTYRVAMSLPLLPFYELSLRAWLYHRLASGKRPLTVIEEALEIPAEEIIPRPERAISLGEINGDPHSVQDVLLTVCGLIQENEQKQFKELSDTLAQHLMAPRDLVFLTHYFVCRWLPRLSPGLGWFVTLMRDRCYFNQRTGEIRNEIQIDGGYSDLAEWLGLRRIKTVWEWLRSEGVAESETLRTTPGENVSYSRGSGFAQTEVGVASKWKLKELFSHNRVNEKSRAVLLDKRLPAQAFVSWLLYSASKNGAAIRDPIGHAISRLIQDPMKGAGGTFDRLAGLPANELAGLLARELQGSSPWNTDWRMAMEGAPHNRLRSLADQLGVPFPVSEYR